LPLTEYGIAAPVHGGLRELGVLPIFHLGIQEAGEPVESIPVEGLDELPDDLEVLFRDGSPSPVY
jgi:hypothetical protein